MDDLNRTKQDLLQELVALRQENEALQKERSQLRDLQERFHFLQVLLDTIPSPFFYKDRAGRYLGCNVGLEKYLGRSRDQIIGKTSAEIYPPENAAQYRRHDLELLQTGGTRTDEDRVGFLPDGREHHVLIKKACYRGKNGEIGGVVGVIAEVNGYPKATDAAENLGRAGSQFLANISQEIRAPLTGIVSLTDLLLRTDLSGAQREYLTLIQQAALTLRQLIHDILDLNKPEKDAADLEIAPFDLYVTIMNGIKIADMAAGNKGLHLLYSIDSSIPQRVRGDKLRLQQILSNILNHAIQCTERGSISVTVTRQGESKGITAVRFRIADTGSGIPPEKLAALFESSRRAEEPDDEGTGLGLAIAKHFIERMGGDLQVQSEVDKGSCFVFTIAFPGAGVPPETGERESSIAQGMARPREAFRILVAEDYEANQIVMGEILKFKGYQYTVVANGIEALKELERNRYDLVLMDVQMPGMSGLEATARLRLGEQGTGRRLPVIGLTGYAMTEDEERCRAAGMDGYLAKPISVKELYDLLDHFLK
ncbi:PAS domain S-box-containing protein [Hydrogenispora ethanolica]|uniref:histidine kinase n=1 Tax=Hydrogenispora ethanolica TaxID=1082276 RepID=A0A4R1RQK5_HYDET|nr:ATP-binding protein [Hydrogenispora ethanolica]TCL68519.1 PAS domain S-box-containing protein [Hydrogenispora ethanolica]